MTKNQSKIFLKMLIMSKTRVQCAFDRRSPCLFRFKIRFVDLPIPFLSHANKVFGLSNLWGWKEKRQFSKAKKILACSAVFAKESCVRYQNCSIERGNCNEKIFFRSSFSSQFWTTWGEF